MVSNILLTDSARTPPSGSITAIGLSAALSARLMQQLGHHFSWEILPGAQQLMTQIQQGILQGDAVLLDAAVTQPVRMAQHVHSFDKTIPVLILAEPDHCAELRRAIMFAPLLGNEVIPCSIADIDVLAQALSRAVERHRQRRHYLDTIASVQPKLGNLSLSQPEVGHYLGRLLDQAPIGVISLDAQGCILGINRQAGLILAINEPEVLGRPLADFFCPSGHQRLANLLTRSTIAQRFSTTPEVVKSVSAGARVRYLEVTASPLAYRARQRGFMVILQDVTVRERTEQQRKKTEDHMRKLSSALEQAADSIFITDVDRVIEYVNPAFEALTGYPKDFAIGRTIHFLRSGVQDKAFYDELWQTISNGHVFRGVLVNRRKDGTIYHEEKTIAPLRNREGEITHFISTGRDITQRLNAEEAVSRHQAELAHVARLSTLGEMTSGLAHELNQPLCAITTYAQTCLRVINAENFNKDKLRYGLEQVVMQAELADAIFQRLRNFSRKSELLKRPVDLCEIVTEVENLVKAELSRHQAILEVVCDEPEADHTVQADPIQVEQVLLNLLRNSLDASLGLTPERKRLILQIHRRVAGGFKISLVDHGRGCPEEAVERLFEPFFTTKPTGLGIGLGISHSIIEAHGGRLFLESNSAAGATFSFTLPPSADNEYPIEQQESAAAGEIK